MIRLHIMLDLETLDDKPGAAITEIAAAAFDPVARTVHPDKFQRRIRNSIERGGTVSTETLAWWFNQNLTGRAGVSAALTGGTSEEIALANFVDWVKTRIISIGAFEICVWSNGASFDIPILESRIRAYPDEMPLSLPWGFRSHRCYRTLVALANNPKVEGEATHVGLDDVERQIGRLFKCMDVLGLKDLQ